MHINQIDFLSDAVGPNSPAAPFEKIAQADLPTETKGGAASGVSANTPMMKQYQAIKAKYRDCLLFFRLGDFYEMFGDDAVTASKVLNLTLTTRNKNTSDPVPLCGVPYHAYRAYLAKLIRSGFKVAVCDQVEDPALAKGIVRREVTRVVTPGMVLDEENLDAKSNNYIASIAPSKDSGSQFGLAFLDITTGEFRVTECAGFYDLGCELYRLHPRQLLVFPGFSAEKYRAGCEAVWDLESLCYLESFAGENRVTDCKKRLVNHFQVQSLDSFGIPCEFASGLVAASMLLQYVLEKQCGDSNFDKVAHIQKLVAYAPNETMLLDPATRCNLEIELTAKDSGPNLPDLVSVLDATVTSMGARKLRSWLNHPLVEKKGIEQRLNRVEFLMETQDLIRGVRAELSRIRDIERIVARVAFNSVSPREVVGLRESLAAAATIRASLKKIAEDLFQSIENRIEPIPELLAHLKAALADDPPVHIKDGGVIRAGFRGDLDELRYVREHAKEMLASIECREKDRTKIANLKLKYNRVFGYFLEVTKPNLDSVPLDYVRKQTISNGERFITAELKELETKILRAEEETLRIEAEAFHEIRKAVLAERAQLLETADALAELDALISYAVIAKKNRYVRPTIDTSRDLEIIQGRHPILEQLEGMTNFVPNDLRCSSEDEQILLITGPNMAGKSTIMRQAALIVLMAQSGSFVPAEKARIGIVDRLFTRIGAQDRLGRGQSTFMVEMNETSAILNRATDRSLVLLDEIGRGTSTYDGVSIAWAVLEYLHEKIRARTLFATHYHELAQLEGDLKGLRNFNVAVKEWGGKIIFLRKFEPGACSKSYGIQVANLAGLPRDVIKRAFAVLKVLEDKRAKIGAKTPSPQMDLFSGESEFSEADYKELQNFRKLSADLNKIDPNRMTPLDALAFIVELQNKMRSS